MHAGLVIYKREGRSLVGQWSHENRGGMLAKETVDQVPAGALVGDWPVKTFSPDNRLLFSGRLKSVTLGGCLKLTWTGNLEEANEPAEFEGLGYQITDDLMFATFESTKRTK